MILGHGFGYMEIGHQAGHALLVKNAVRHTLTSCEQRHERQQGYYDNTISHRKNPLFRRPSLRFPLWVQAETC